MALDTSTSGLGKVAHLKKMESVRIRNVETFGNIQKLTLKVTEINNQDRDAISPYRFGLGQVFYTPPTLSDDQDLKKNQANIWTLKTGEKLKLQTLKVCLHWDVFVI